MYRGWTIRADVTCIVTAVQRPTYFLLAALREGPAYAPGITARAAELSDGEVLLAAGTLYGALKRLLGEGLVEVVGQELVNGSWCSVYRLTIAGQEALVAQARRYEAAAQAVLKGSAP
jgi:DNA-binding PadR family transcriptional regulator